MQKEQISKILEKKIPKEKIILDENMSKHTSFKIGGTADLFIKIDNIENLKYVLDIARKYDINIQILGNGSNILISDTGIRGIVLKIEFNQITKISKTEIKVGSGVKLGLLAQILAKEQLEGFEELSGIPGTIGGAVKQNAGAHGKEIKDILKSVTVMDYLGNIITLKNSELEFSYRHSIINSKKYIILDATFIFQQGKKEEILNKINEYKKWREEKQPLEYPNAGSIFKRGEDYITAKLIDECGLKGYQIGGAKVSTKHAGFIINTGNASSKDVIELIEYIKKEVQEKFKKNLQLEIEII